MPEGCAGSRRGDRMFIFQCCFRNQTETGCKKRETETRPRLAGTRNTEYESGKQEPKRTQRRRPRQRTEHCKQNRKTGARDRRERFEKFSRRGTCRNGCQMRHYSIIMKLTTKEGIIIIDPRKTDQEQFNKTPCFYNIRHDAIGKIVLQNTKRCELQGHSALYPHYKGIRVH